MALILECDMTQIKLSVCSTLVDCSTKGTAIHRFRLNLMRQNNYRIFKEQRRYGARHQLRWSPAPTHAKPPMHRKRCMGGFAKHSARRRADRVVEPVGIEPTTPCLQSRCSPS